MKFSDFLVVLFGLSLFSGGISSSHVRRIDTSLDLSDDSWSVSSDCEYEDTSENICSVPTYNDEENGVGYWTSCSKKKCSIVYLGKSDLAGVEELSFRVFAYRTSHFTIGTDLAEFQFPMKTDGWQDFDVEGFNGTQLLSLSVVADSDIIIFDKVFVTTSEEPPTTETTTEETTTETTTAETTEETTAETTTVATTEATRETTQETTEASTERTTQEPTEASTESTTEVTTESTFVTTTETTISTLPTTISTTDLTVESTISVLPTVETTTDDSSDPTDKTSVSADPTTETANPTDSTAENTSPTSSTTEETSSSSTMETVYPTSSTSDIKSTTPTSTTESGSSTNPSSETSSPTGTTEETSNPTSSTEENTISSTTIDENRSSTLQDTNPTYSTDSDSTSTAISENPTSQSPDSTEPSTEDGTPSTSDGSTKPSELPTTSSPRKTEYLDKSEDATDDGPWSIIDCDYGRTLEILSENCIESPIPEDPERNIGYWSPCSRRSCKITYTANPSHSFSNQMREVSFRSFVGKDSRIVIKSGSVEIGIPGNERWMNTPFLSGFGETQTITFTAENGVSGITIFDEIRVRTTGEAEVTESTISVSTSTEGWTITETTTTTLAPNTTVKAPADDDKSELYLMMILIAVCLVIFLMTLLIIFTSIRRVCCKARRPKQEEAGVDPNSDLEMSGASDFQKELERYRQIPLNIPAPLVTPPPGYASDYNNGREYTTGLKLQHSPVHLSTFKPLPPPIPPKAGPSNSRGTSPYRNGEIYFRGSPPLKNGNSQGDEVQMLPRLMPTGRY